MDGILDGINRFLDDPITKWIGYYLLTLFSASLMNIFSLHKGFKGAEEFLKTFWPGRSDRFYFRINFITVAVSGSIIGMIFYAPDSGLKSLVAGFSWVGALNTLMNRGEKEGK